MMTKQTLSAYLTLRNVIVGLLALVAVLSSWYIISEDGRVGNTYATIFRQHPALVPSDLVPLAALHIQTAVAITQICVTVALAFAFTQARRRIPAEPDPHTQQLAEAIEHLASALSLPAAASVVLVKPIIESSDPAEEALP